MKLLLILLLVSAAAAAPITLSQAQRTLDGAVLAREEAVVQAQIANAAITAPVAQPTIQPTIPPAAPPPAAAAPRPVTTVCGWCQRVGHRNVVDGPNPCPHRMRAEEAERNGQQIPPGDQKMRTRGQPYGFVRAVRAAAPKKKTAKKAKKTVKLWSVTIGRLGTDVENIEAKLNNFVQKKCVRYDPCTIFCDGQMVLKSIINPTT